MADSERLVFLRLLAKEEWNILIKFIPLFWCRTAPSCFCWQNSCPHFDIVAGTWELFSAAFVVERVSAACFGCVNLFVDGGVACVFV